MGGNGRGVGDGVMERADVLMDKAKYRYCTYVMIIAMALLSIIITVTIVIATLVIKVDVRILTIMNTTKRMATIVTIIYILLVDTKTLIKYDSSFIYSKLKKKQTNA